LNQDGLGVHVPSPKFRENEVTVLPAWLAFNLSHVPRSELADSVGGGWDLTRFRHYVWKAGGRAANRSRRLFPGGVLP